MEESSDTQEQLKDEKQTKALATDTYSKDDGTSKEESGSEPVKLRGQLKRNKRSLIFRNSLGAALMEQFTNSYLRENRLHQLECVLDWKDVKYEIKPTRLDKAKAYFNPLAPKPTVKTVVTSLSGFAKPGTLTAIIGASGAGKTSLLNILANRLVSKHISGEFFINSDEIKLHKKTRKLRNIVGFVTQADLLLPFLTVRETLMFAAMLTLPSRLSFSEKCKRVEQIMQELGLSKVAETYIGGPLQRGISGGEKKRVSIAVQLLRDPAILLLDEPTSGLDSKTSLKLIEHLKYFSTHYNQTLVASIHQPRSKIFALFDKVLILSPTGAQIYFGGTHKVVDYFSALGYPCPIHENPADFVLDKCAYDFGDPHDLDISKNRIADLSQKWIESSHKPICQGELGVGSIKDLTKDDSPNWFTQVFWVTQREFRNEVRNKSYFFVRMFQALFYGLVLGFVFFDLAYTQESIYDRLGLMLWLLLVTSFFEIVGGMLVFITNRDVLYQERDSNMYSTSSYWVAKQLALLPFQLIYPSITVFAVYWLAGLQNVWYKFSIFYASVLFTAFCTNSLGMVMGAGLPPSVALVAGPMSNYLNFIMMGYLVNFKNIPVPLNYVTYISFSRYAFDAAAQNEFYGLSFSCKESQKVGQPPRCPYATGEEFIPTLHLLELDYYQDFLIILAFIVFYRILLYFILRFSRSTGR